MQTRLLRTDTADRTAEAVREAAMMLRNGEPVAVPTETVYGLAADALNPIAAARIFEAKQRPFFDPLISHLPSLEWLERLAILEGERRRTALALAERFWPGPLTLVLPRREIVPDLVTAGLPTAAFRMSAHPIFQAILAEFGGPAAAPSANRFGRISPTTAEAVVEELTGRIPLVIDGGPCSVGIESTIAAIEPDGIRILREGPILREALAEFAPVLERETSGSLEAPGQMKSHYAPGAPLRLVPHGSAAAAWAEAIGETGAKVALLPWNAAPDLEAGAVEVLSPTGDAAEAAATLFAKLRRLDASGADLIVAERAPEFGLGIAIMDRLRKAAALGNADPN